jgi:hypothetical protein
VNTPMQPTDRRGQYGLAQPAFTIHRFKRTLILALNEEMAEELNGILLDNEKRLKGPTPSYLYEFTTQLQEALDQPPPQKGEKPNTLAPGRSRPRTVAQAS